MCLNHLERHHLIKTVGLFSLLVGLCLMAPIFAAPLAAAEGGLSQGYYLSSDEDNPGNFIFCRDGTGLFATEEYIAYFTWKVEGKNIEMVFLKGKQDDKIIKASYVGPDSFKFEKFIYKRLKGANLEKYKLSRDTREGTLILARPAKPGAKGARAFIFLNVQDGNADKLCEIEAKCSGEGDSLICKDNYPRRKMSGKITLSNLDTPEITLESTITGSHNYQKKCDYAGVYKLVK